MIPFLAMDCRRKLVAAPICYRRVLIQQLLSENVKIDKPFYHLFIHTPIPFKNCDISEQKNRHRRTSWKFYLFLIFIPNICLPFVFPTLGSPSRITIPCNENCNFHLKDVDFFSFSTQTWTSLPPMNKVCMSVIVKCKKVNKQL